MFDLNQCETATWLHEIIEPNIAVQRDLQNITYDVILSRSYSLFLMLCYDLVTSAGYPQVQR